MQYAGISVVKNESDIIEIFIRHNLKHLNKLYIVDHNSQDNTFEILGKLKEEGYNLEIYKNSSSRHIQAEEFNKLIREADSDFITFIDADEFIIANKLELPDDVVSFMTWHNYIPHPTDNHDEINVLKRIRYRLPIDYNQHKAFIPKSIYSRADSFVLLGGHEIYYKNGEDIVPAPYRIEPSVHLAHFPMRSLSQIKVKAFSNWLSKLANPLHQSGRLQNGKIPTWHHWKKLFDLFKNNPDITENEAAEAVVEAYMRNKLDLIHDPIESEDKIIYDMKPLAPLFALADTAERQVVMLQKANSFIINVTKEVEKIGSV